MTTPGHHSSAAPDKHDRTQPIERVVFFPDAVAIAMTLLILPLMESVSEAPEQGDTAVWLNAHSSQVLSFAMSFLPTRMGKPSPHHDHSVRAGRPDRSRLPASQPLRDVPAVSLRPAAPTDFAAIEAAAVHRVLSSLSPCSRPCTQ